MSTTRATPRYDRSPLSPHRPLTVGIRPHRLMVDLVDVVHRSSKGRPVHTVAGSWRSLVWQHPGRSSTHPDPWHPRLGGDGIRRPGAGLRHLAPFRRVVHRRRDRDLCPGRRSGKRCPAHACGVALTSQGSHRNRSRARDQRRIGAPGCPPQAHERPRDGREALAMTASHSTGRMIGNRDASRVAIH